MSLLQGMSGLPCLFTFLLPCCEVSSRPRSRMCVSILQPSCRHSSSPPFANTPTHARTAHTDWLSHLGQILKGVWFMVHAIDQDKLSLLSHCSDGWDRTSQLCSLTQICLDPYFRTTRGFMVRFSARVLLASAEDCAGVAGAVGIGHIYSIIPSTREPTIGTLSIVFFILSMSSVSLAASSALLCARFIFSASC